MSNITLIIDNKTGEIITILEKEQHGDALRDIFRSEEKWNCRSHVRHEGEFEIIEGD